MQALSAHVAALAQLNRRAATTELTAALAHELQQPLGAIRRNGEAARALLASGRWTVSALQEIVDDVLGESDRAAEIIRRLRQLLQNREIGEERTNLNDVVRDVVSLVEPEAAYRVVRLEVDLLHAPLMVIGDQVHLRQVLLNLLLNGMDAMSGMPAGSRRLAVRTAVRNGRAEVAVRDEGTGIRPELMTRIFEPFFTTKPEGMGIGLSIARTIIEAHKGRLMAANNATGGATFRFSLPRL
jgi:C4-dicarboxylate-specific signal transduction histidine kinase